MMVEAARSCMTGQLERQNAAWTKSLDGKNWSEWPDPFVWYFIICVVSKMKVTLLEIAGLPGQPKLCVIHTQHTDRSYVWSVCGPCSSFWTSPILICFCWPFQISGYMLWKYNNDSSQSRCKAFRKHFPLEEEWRHVQGKDCCRYTYH